MREIDDPVREVTLLGEVVKGGQPTALWQAPVAERHCAPVQGQLFDPGHALDGDGGCTRSACSAMVTFGISNAL